jgi:hypothetical protein
MCSKADSKNSSVNVTNIDDIQYIQNSIDNTSQLNNEHNLTDEIIEIDELSLEINRIKPKHFFVDYTENNKYIGYIYLGNYPKLDIKDVYIFENYLVINERTDEWNSEYCVYEYRENLKYSEYKKVGKKLHEMNSLHFRLVGIHNDLLFWDIGTSHLMRGVIIVDLANSKVLLRAGYHFVTKKFDFKNNIVTGLVFNEEMMKRDDIDEKIKKEFYTSMNKTEIPEIEEKVDWGRFEFLLEYEYSVVTNEIINFKGKYIYDIW